MNLLQAKQFIGTQLGINEDDTTMSSNLGSWLNRAYRDICGKHQWSWLKDVESVQMIPDITTGTVDATAASSTITFSDAPAASQTGKYIQFSSGDDWYLVESHTAGALTATISPAYIQTTNLTAGTYTLRQFYYTLSTSAAYVYGARQANSPTILSIVDTTRYDEAAPFTDATGSPTSIIFWGYNSSGQWKFTPYPFPDSLMLIEFRIIKKITTDLTDSDSPLFPERFTDIWLEGAKRYAYEFMDDTREDKVRKRFDDRLREEEGLDEMGLGKERVLQSMDNRKRSVFQPFPPEFGA